MSAADPAEQMIFILMKRIQVLEKKVFKKKRPDVTMGKKLLLLREMGLLEKFADHFKTKKNLHTFLEIILDQLLEKIGKLIDSKLSQADAPPKTNQSILLSRAEVAKTLKISFPTLHDWTKQGWLQSYKIGNRILYKSNEVEDALQKVSN